MDRKKTTWLIVAPSERQSLESLEKWKEHAVGMKLAIADIEQVRDGKSGESLIKSTTITFPRGSRVIAVPGRPDTVRGFSAHVLATEFAFFDDPDQTWRALLPSITNPLRGGLKKVRLISTPNGIGNKFHDLWAKNYLPQKNAESTKGNSSPENPALSSLRSFAANPSRWSCHKITITDALAQGLPVDIEELRTALDDPEGWAQEYDPLDFLDTSSVLLPYELIVSCENPLATEAAPSGFWDHASRITDHAPIFCGIDFGRKRDLTVCWSLQLQGGSFKMTREVLCLEAMSTPEQIEILRPRLQRAQRVCLDYTGSGVGLGDFLAKEFGEYDPAKHQFGKIELCTFTSALKTEIFPKLRMEFERKLLGFPVSRACREDAHSINRVIAPGGGVTYKASHTAEGHADRTTALALANRAADFGQACAMLRPDSIRSGTGRPNLRPVFVPRRLTPLRRFHP